MGVRSALYQSQPNRRLLSRGHPDLASDVDNDAALVAFVGRQTLLKREAEEERKRLEELMRRTDEEYASPMFSSQRAELSRLRNGE